VQIEAQGESTALHTFSRRLLSDAPPLARVEQVLETAQPLTHGAAGFVILHSQPGGAVSTQVPPDTATCAECLAELFDPTDRRWRHPFINCTQCGPRYTLTRRLPYDREQTSMAAFAQCPSCLLEYGSPGDRRFHAEPNACPRCGPQLRLCGADGLALPGAAADPITDALALLRAGRIVAIKGLGGFHLACDARNAQTVAQLRRRKQREEKPFAVMVANATSAAQWVALDASAHALLESPERPIVLLPLLGGGADPLVGVAPGLHELGVMLPCTPIQFLLFHEAAGRPVGTGWLTRPQALVLVMTSANPGGQPLVLDNAESLATLHGLADAWLLHDRDIVARCDDSVVRPMALAPPQFVRRARGYTPRPIKLPRAGPSVLATGAAFKNTLCMTRGDEAFLSPHIGDLDNAASCTALAEAAAHLSQVLGVQPQALAHDLHPDFFSTHFAREQAHALGLPLVGVQHHHAHIAAVAAEHGVQRPVLGLALDGIGLGRDGGAWGGELLRVHGAEVERLGHLAELPMPGGDRGAREPWRMAAAALHGLGRGQEIAARWPSQAGAPAIAEMLARGLRCPPTSSMGRWFDAAAGLLGLRSHSAFEGQAPMLLEALAGGAVQTGISPREAADLARLGDDGVLDLLPLLARLADENDAARGAAFFHAALADGLARWAAQAAERTGLRCVALGGGCFLNALLSHLLLPLLAQRGLQVMQARQAPPNDGGIALGQAWVAMQQLLSGD
jgi:hydrogenase maturation protein HypF